MKRKMKMKNFEDKLKKLIFSLKRLYEESDYDALTYVHSLLEQTHQLCFFYCFLENQSDEDEVFYSLKKRPKRYQLAYFNIGRGFPKELCDGHWCYVYHDYGVKMFVIPCTSIKDDSPASHFEMDIKIERFRGADYVRLQFGDARMVDVQRLDIRKEFVEVLESSKEIKKRFLKFMD